MKNTIWKYELEITGKQVLTIPCEHQFLSVQNQGGSLVAWYQLDPDAPTVDLQMGVFGTGHLIKECPGTYLGSAQFQDGALVWHVFSKVL